LSIVETKRFIKRFYTLNTKFQKHKKKEEGYLAKQGKHFSGDELNNILTLLRESDMSIQEIADRMRCSRSAVVAINRKFQIRLYGGRRSQWALTNTKAIGTTVA